MGGDGDRHEGVTPGPVDSTEPGASGSSGEVVLGDVDDERRGGAADDGQVGGRGDVQRGSERVVAALPDGSRVMNEFVVGGLGEADAGGLPARVGDRVDDGLQLGGDFGEEPTVEGHDTVAGASEIQHPHPLGAILVRDRPVLVQRCGPRRRVDSECVDHRRHRSPHLCGGALHRGGTPVSCRGGGILGEDEVVRIVRGDECEGLVGRAEVVGGDAVADRVERCGGGAQPVRADPARQQGLTQRGEPRRAAATGQRGLFADVLPEP